MSAAGARARQRAGIDPALLGFLAEQPHRRYLDLAGKRLLLIHSTPWEPRGEICASAQREAGPVRRG